MEHPVCAGSSLSSHTGSVRSELQKTNMETKRINQAWLDRKNRFTISRKDFWKLNSCPGLGAAIEGCVTSVWKRPGRSQQNCNVATRFLITEAKRGKKRSWSGRFRTGQSSRLFFWWRRNPSAGLSAGAAHYFIPDRFAVFPLTFSNARSVPSPSSKVFRQTSSVVYDGSRPQHKEGLSAGL